MPTRFSARAAQKGTPSDLDPGYANSQEWMRVDTKTLNRANRTGLQERQGFADISFYLTFPGHDASPVAQFLFAHFPPCPQGASKAPNSNGIPLATFKCLVQQGGRPGLWHQLDFGRSKVFWGGLEFSGKLKKRTRCTGKSWG